MLTTLSAAAGAPVAVPMHPGTEQVENPPKTLFDGNLTVGGIVILFGLVLSFLGNRWSARKDKRDIDQRQEEREEHRQKKEQEREDRLKAEISKHNDTVEKRLTTLETKSTDFMPRAEIEAKIEHEKANRLAGNAATQRALERHDDAISGMRVDIAALGVRIDGTSSALVRVEAAIEKQTEKIEKLIARST